MFFLRTYIYIKSLLHLPIRPSNSLTNSNTCVQLFKRSQDVTRNSQNKCRELFIYIPVFYFEPVLIKRILPLMFVECKVTTANNKPINDCRIIVFIYFNESLTNFTRFLVKGSVHDSVNRRPLLDFHLEGSYLSFLFTPYALLLALFPFKRETLQMI